MTTVDDPLQFRESSGSYVDTITVALDDDSLDEADGDVSVTIQADPTPPFDYVVHATNNKGTAPVMDNDPEPELTMAVTPGDEGTAANGSVEFTPTLAVVSGRDVVVSYWTSLDTSGTDPAEAGDFMAIAQSSPDSITIPAGSLTPLESDGTTVDTISITTIADDIHEEDETFILNFNGDFSRETAGTTAIGTILNDDAAPTIPEISLSEVPNSVTQGHDFTFKVSASGTLSGDLPITLTLSDGNNGIITGMTPGTLGADGTGSLTIPQAGSEVVTVSTKAVAGTDTQDYYYYFDWWQVLIIRSQVVKVVETAVQSKNNTVASGNRPRVWFESYSEIPVNVNTAEGSQITFKIMSSHATTSPPTVNIYVDTMNSYLNGDPYSDYTELIELQAWRRILWLFRVTLQHLWAPGTITVELLDGDGYTLADADLHKTEASVVCSWNTLQSYRLCQ